MKSLTLYKTDGKIEKISLRKGQKYFLHWDIFNMVKDKNADVQEVITAGLNEKESELYLDVE